MIERIERNRCIGLALVGCACIGIIVSGIMLEDFGKGKVYDREGEEIGRIYLEDGSLQYQCGERDEAYLNLVCEEAVEKVMEEHNIDKEQAMKELASRGTKIYTPFCREIQKAVQETYDDDLGAGIGNSAAAVCDGGGALLGCFSMSDTMQNYNYVTMPTYAGSAIKPLSVYAPALEEGVISWSSLYRDSPYAMAENQSGQMEEWPANTEPYTDQMITVEEAVSTSNNAVAVKVLKDYGVERSCYLLQDGFGIDTDYEIEKLEEQGEERILSNIALGYLEKGVTVQKMAEAYQVFLNGGVYCPSYTVEEIQRKGELYYSLKREEHRVFTPETAYITNRLLQSVVQNGTGSAAQVEGLDVCGKTGTSEYGDHWFVGVTPEYSCAVWYKEGVAGGDTDRAAAMFRQIAETMPRTGENRFLQPMEVSELEYCTESGQLAGEACRQTKMGYFNKLYIGEKCSLCR